MKMSNAVDLGVLAENELAKSQGAVSTFELRSRIVEYML
jgi:hypothetical protein